MSNPGLYDEQVAHEICTRMALGETLSKISSDPKMPQLSTIYNWRTTHPDFDVAYISAREDQMHAWADQVVSLMDEAVPDRVEFDKSDPRVKKYERGGKVVFEIDGKHLTHVKEMIKIRQWVMSKIAPHHYGDRQMVHNTYGVDHKSDDELVNDLREALNKSGMTPADLVTLLAKQSEVTE